MISARISTMPSHTCMTGKETGLLWCSRMVAVLRCTLVSVAWDMNVLVLRMGACVCV